MSCKLSQYTNLNSTKFTKTQEYFQEAIHNILSCFDIEKERETAKNGNNGFLKMFLNFSEFCGVQMYVLTLYTTYKCS